MKNKFIYFAIIIVSVFLSGSYYEDIMNENLETAEKSGFYDVLSEDTKKVLKKAGLDEISTEALLDLSFSDLLFSIVDGFTDKIKEPIKTSATVFSSVIICAVVQSFCNGFLKSDIAINSVAALSASVVILMPIKKSMESAAQIITECSEFMLGFIPVYSSAAAATGYISSAAAFKTLMLSTVTVISRLSSEIILPLISIYLALCMAGAVSEIDIGGISKAVKNFAVWILCAAMTVFSGIMGLGTLITASSDGTFSKTARFIIGSSIPIVGGTVSDALSTIKGCLLLTKNVLGIYAIVIIAIIFIPSILNLSVWKICLSAASGAGDIFGNKKLCGFLSSAASVMGITLALVVISAVMFIFSISIMLMTGGGT